MPMQASAMMEDDQCESGSSSAGRMPMSIFDISRKGLNALAVSPDGTRLATAARDGVVRIHDLTNGALLASFRVRARRHALALHQHINSSFHFVKAGVRLPAQVLCAWAGMHTMQDRNMWSS